MRDMEVDIKLMAETNVNWSKLADSNQLRERAFGYFRSSRSVTAHNKTTPWPKDYQPGGTAILCTEQASYRSRTVGRDKTGLGRWCWVRLDDNKACIPEFLAHTNRVH